MRHRSEETEPDTDTQITHKADVHAETDRQAQTEAGMQKKKPDSRTRRGI